LRADRWSVKLIKDMRTIRGRLRLWVSAWLVCQVASLSALVPRECCAAHRTVASKPGCHEMAEVPHCPMPAADGTQCPMHRAGHAHEQPADGCAMRGMCDGPLAAFSASLWNHGVLTDPFEAQHHRHAFPAILQTGGNPISRLPSLDPPPPRA
jgi:hypothetical protein